MYRQVRWKLGLAAAVLIGSPAYAQSAPQAGVAGTAATTVDPVAIQALRSMGNYLKTLNSFELRSKATIETNMENTDLKVSLGLENTYRVQRPNAFFIELRSDRQYRQFYYDGRKFTVNVPRQGFYAAVDAPPTELPPSEWSIDYDSLDQGRDDECLRRSTSPRRLSGSCVRL
ncbi:DUF2092 domain-containing protein, partial [Sphingomonas sp. ACRSK]|uniref:DUF2092 domain-containing protein n=1 Tax=Sphingomonas sp. ACRSK TaxID=2918213 RepID=UPI001EF51546